MSIQDSGLINRARCGDPDAIVEIYERHQASIFTYIYYRVSGQEIAEDLTAEVFVRMVSRIKDYVDRGRPILTWLYVIARNLIVDHYRNKCSVGQMPLREELIAGDCGDPIKAADSRLIQDNLMMALSFLTEEQRLVILLKIFEDRENAEVAAILGKSERAIRSLQHRALAALRRVMVKEKLYV
jgi:RNA polymerase sigma-70 factor (ECF subfamily)